MAKKSQVSESLSERRERAAQKAFENAPLEGLEEAGRSWIEDGDYWSIELYWENEEPDGDSITGSFGVEFKPKTAKIIDKWWK